MDKEKLIPVKNGLSTSGILLIIGTIVGVFTIGIISVIYQSPESQNLTPTYSSSPLPTTNVPIQENPSSLVTTQLSPQSNSTFNNISKADQDRIRDIIEGVIQNTISVTPDLKEELRGILKKYNATDEEIDNFATYGPAFPGVWNQYFFLDALEAVSSGTPVKSNERSNLEKEALSRGLMTLERIRLNDEKMELIASHQPVTGLDGKQVILTADTIKSTTDNLGLMVDRLVLLFK